MSVAVSAGPRMRWTFWASKSARGGDASGRVPRAGRLNGVSSVRATDHLHGVVLGGAAGGVDGGEHGDQDRGAEGLDVHAQVFAHQEAFGFYQAFDFDGEGAEAFDYQLAHDDA